jgi:hypothetical protein
MPAKRRGKSDPPRFHQHASDMPSQGHGKRSSATRDGPPPVKRFRVSRACDQCRQNREKCDGNQPQCAPCSDGKRQCTYSSSPKKRGLPPGYIRTIELALALAFQQDAELEASLTAKLGYVRGLHFNYSLSASHNFILCTELYRYLYYTSRLRKNAHVC